jgi:hypothetical protein
MSIFQKIFQKHLYQKHSDSLEKYVDEVLAQQEKEAEELRKCPLGLTSLEFKKMFVPQFLSTMAANRFNDYCAAGKQEQISALPFEDAEFLAEEVYKKYYEFKN